MVKKLYIFLSHWLARRGSRGIFYKYLREKVFRMSEAAKMRSENQHMQELIEKDRDVHIGDFKKIKRKIYASND